MYRVACLALLVVASAARAQGRIEHLEPPVLARGQVTRVVLVGTNLARPLDLWTALPGGAIKVAPVGEATPTRAVLDVTVAADAPVGVFGLRLATTAGLSNAALALVDDLPVKAAAPKVALPAALWGRFRAGAMDRYTLDVQAGQRVSFEVVGNRLGKDVDPLLTIRDAQGRFVAERDNDGGLYFDLRFEHEFRTAGSYTVEVRDARFHGHEHGTYVLRMGKFPAGRVAVPAVVKPGSAVRLPEVGGDLLPVTVPSGQRGVFFGPLKRAGDEGSTWVPLEASPADVTVHQMPGNSMETATPAKVPGVLCGVLLQPGERHFYRLDLAKGQKVQVRAEAKSLNSPADLEIGITDATGKEQRRAGENQQEEIALDYNAGNAGVYGLTVRDISRSGGPAFAYRLEVTGTNPRVSAVAEAEGLTVPRGTYQPIPLSLSRGDYAGPVTLELVGAPPGVTLTPTEVSEKENGVVCKLTASAEAPLGLHTLQILAKPTNAPDAQPTLVRTRPLIDRSLVNVDLIPIALREDQRRLPPALADRFALQVTPASPFTFELPQALVTLPRYQRADYPIVTTRVPGFDGPLTFTAKGGQLAAKGEGRTRVYADFAGDKAGSIHSRILTNLAKHRVDVTATGTHQGRSVSLTRTFDLDVRTAFTVTAESVKTEPGTTVKVRLNVERLKSFAGDVTLDLSPATGFTFAEKVTIPRGTTSAELDVKIDADRPNGRHGINWNATGLVDGFEEEQRGRVEIEVMKPVPPKK